WKAYPIFGRLSAWSLQTRVWKRDESHLDCFCRYRARFSALHSISAVSLMMYERVIFPHILPLN
ncbi:MAG: hypothetical protein JXA13_15700, partial [Anaerolineales bacterium]|nr:hypothetical protein [Anaerolineales bacterium]